eukprot:703164-Amphidinium_carterae.1
MYAPFLRAIAAEAIRKMPSFEAREISNLVWAVTILGPGIVDSIWLDKALEHFAKLISEARGACEGWEMVHLLNACWRERRRLKQWLPLAKLFASR